MTVPTLKFTVSKYVVLPISIAILLSLASCNIVKSAAVSSDDGQSLVAVPKNVVGLASSSSPVDEPAGINIQTGYEGYLIPVLESIDDNDDDRSPKSPATLQRIGKYLAILAKDVLPKIGTALLKAGSKLAVVVSVAILVLVAGSAFTTFLCVFTPFCTIHFSHLTFDREHTEDMMRGLLTPERTNMLNAIVKAAIQKYREDRKSTL